MGYEKGLQKYKMGERAIASGELEDAKIVVIDEQNDLEKENRFN